jgi:putative transposase
MHEWESLSHVRWESKYHVVTIPKYRRKVLYGKLKGRVGRILRELCEQRGVELVEGKAMSDHVHMCLSIPPKYSVAHTVGFLKGIHPVLAGHGPTLFQGLPRVRRLELIATTSLKSGVLTTHYRRNEG